MPNTLEDLRSHLFATLASLRDKDNPMDVDRARAISEVAKTVIDSAKAEVEYIKATGQDQLALPVFGAIESPKSDDKPGAPQVLGVRTHRIK